MKPDRGHSFSRSFSFRLAGTTNLETLKIGSLEPPPKNQTFDSHPIALRLLNPASDLLGACWLRGSPKYNLPRGPCALAFSLERPNSFEQPIPTLWKHWRDPHQEHEQGENDAAGISKGLHFHKPANPRILESD